MSKSKKKNKKKAKAKAKVLAVLQPEPNKVVALLEFNDAPDAPKEGTWEAFKKWISKHWE